MPTGRIMFSAGAENGMDTARHRAVRVSPKKFRYLKKNSSPRFITRLVASSHLFCPGYRTIPRPQK